MFVFNICIFIHLHTDDMTILQDPLVLRKLRNWRIWRDLLASKAFRKPPKLLFPTQKKKKFFFYFQKKLSKIWLICIMKQILKWSGLRGKKWNSTNEFLERFTETSEEKFILLPKKTICSLAKHENGLIEILNFFNS